MGGGVGRRAKAALHRVDMELAGVAANTQQVEPTQLHARREPTHRIGRRRSRRGGRANNGCIPKSGPAGEGGGAQHTATCVR